MPVTALDARTALLIVDLQNGIVRSAAAGLSDEVPSMTQVLDRARALIDAFRRHALPVVLINVAGGAPGRTDEPARFSGSLPAGFTDFVAELAQKPEDLVVTKRSWGAFANTDLDARMQGADMRNAGPAPVIKYPLSDDAFIAAAWRRPHCSGSHHGR